MPQSYFKPLATLLEANADSGKALTAKAYMKGHFDYYGMRMQDRRDLMKQFFTEQGWFEKERLTEMVEWCWKQPQREWQYVGMEAVQKFIKKSDPSILPLLEMMLSTKSWWDTVDMIATNCVGVLFQKFPELIVPTTQKWMDSNNMWLQRTCIIFQLKYRLNTDTNLMFEYMLRLNQSNEFFIQKAIGWALRQHSKYERDLIVDFIRDNELKPLSKREGMKWLRERGLD